MYKVRSLNLYPVWGVLLIPAQFFFHHSKLSFLWGGERCCKLIRMLLLEVNFHSSITSFNSTLHLHALSWFTSVFLQKITLGGELFNAVACFTKRNRWCLYLWREERQWLGKEADHRVWKQVCSFPPASWRGLMKRYECLGLRYLMAEHPVHPHTGSGSSTAAAVIADSVWLTRSGWTAWGQPGYLQSLKRTVAFCCMLFWKKNQKHKNQKNNSSASSQGSREGGNQPKSSIH